jgi:hypothetical protein
MSDVSTEADRSLDLLYPFYLDTDMSMAFAAALAGGVALEAEQVDRSGATSEAVKNLRGSLRLWRAGGLEAGREESTSSDAASESRLVRRHTAASIFIDLHDELRRAELVRQEPQIEDMRIGEIVSAQMGPAVAPLRRVVDQVIRLLDVMLPMIGVGDADDDQSASAGSRQDRRQQAREAAKRSPAPEHEGSRELQAIRRLFVALRDDLEHSGMIDIVVSRTDAPSAVLTLDKRFVSPPTLELLHTSKFTVVGKVTQLWPSPDVGVNLYRRSVLTLVPSLGQSIAWGVFAMLAGLARSLDVGSMERMARDAVGDGAETGNTSTEANPDATPNANEVLIGDDIAALNPVIMGPAFQMLPLAICS